LSGNNHSKLAAQKYRITSALIIPGANLERLLDPELVDRSRIREQVNPRRPESKVLVIVEVAAKDPVRPLPVHGWQKYGPRYSSSLRIQRCDPVSPW
jgi:hypothetical protein